MYVRKSGKTGKITFQLLAEILLTRGLKPRDSWPVLSIMSNNDPLGHARTPKYTWRRHARVHPSGGRSDQTCRSGRSCQSCRSCQRCVGDVVGDKVGDVPDTRPWLGRTSRTNDKKTDQDCTHICTHNTPMTPTMYPPGHPGTHAPTLHPV